MTCPNCSSGDLRWHLGKRGPSDVQDGRLRMHDVSVIAFLGCEECSETIEIIEDHEIEDLLNANRPPAEHPKEEGP